MALSENERRRLEEIEQHLEEDDRKFARRMGVRTAISVPSRVLAAGMLVSTAGFLTLIAAIFQRIIILGVAGFIIMGAGVYLATLRFSWAGTLRRFRGTSSAQQDQTS